MFQGVREAAVTEEEKGKPSADRSSQQSGGFHHNTLAWRELIWKAMEDRAANDGRRTRSAVGGRSERSLNEVPIFSDT